MDQEMEMEMKSLPRNYGNFWNSIWRKDAVMITLPVIPMSNAMTSFNVWPAYSLRLSGMVCRWRNEEWLVIEFTGRKGMVDFLVDPSEG